jgi:AcrR family transcriptional regulator
MTLAAGDRPRRRARKGDGPALRKELLDAARTLLKQTESEEAVSIRAVAAAVGVSTPAVYLHFADKTALIGAVCAAVFEDLDEQMQAARAGVEDPMQALREFGLAYVRFAAAHPEEYRIALMSRSPEGVTGPASLEESPAFAHVLDLVRECQQSGAFSPDVDPVRIGTTLWAMAHGLAAIGVIKPDLVDAVGLESLATEAIEAIGVGIAVMHRIAPNDCEPAASAPASGPLEAGEDAPRSLAQVLNETLGPPRRASTD